MSQTLEVITFISMNGKAKQAIAFYEKHFMAERLLYVTYEQMAKRDRSISLTEENKEYVSHCVLKIGIQNL